MSDVDDIVGLDDISGLSDSDPDDAMVAAAPQARPLRLETAVHKKLTCHLCTFTQSCLSRWPLSTMPVTAYTSMPERRSARPAHPTTTMQSASRPNQCKVHSSKHIGQQGPCKLGTG